MNVLQAGFDWISLLIIVIAGIIGMVKSTKAQKKRQQPTFSPSYPEEEEKPEQDWTEEKELSTYFDDLLSKTPQKEELTMPGDYYQASKPVQEEVKDTIDTFEEDKKEEIAHFNLRQAIISSEILKRPEF